MYGPSCSLCHPKVLIGYYTRSDMQGVQKVKCASCGTMFMSETGNAICPTCSENHGNQSHESNVGGGCGCGHSH